MAIFDHGIARSVSRKHN